jgi:4-amino-4-deoxy-L-arabinose transferase-like glycosyltransferase
VQETRKNLRLLPITAYGCIGALAYFLCLHFIGVESMHYGDEVTHARVIQEGIDSSAWFRLTLDGEPYYNKPPFKMWLTRLVVALFGEGNLQYRLLDGLATLGTVSLTMLLAFRFFGSHLAAVVSGLLLLGSWDFLVESRNNQGTQDAMLHFLITTSMVVGWSLLRHVHAGKSRDVRRSILGLAILVGLAISTKSLAGGLPILLVLIALLGTLRTRFVKFIATYWKTLLVGVLIVVAIPGLYYIPLLLREPNAWGYVFHREIYDRLLGPGYHNQARWELYLNGIFVKRPTFPVVVMLLGSVVAVAHLFRGRNRGEWAFLLAWIAIPLTLYSSFSSRIFHYIAPVFPPLAILCGQGLAWSTTAAIRLIRRSALPLAACAAFVLLPCYYLIGSNLRYTIRYVSTSGKKLDIEKIVTNIQSARMRGPARVIVFKMQRFLGEHGYQAWRFKFYLHFIRDEIRYESEIQRLAEEVKLPSPLWILAPIDYRDQIIALSSPCEVLPFVHYEGRRNHHRSDEMRQGLGKPQFILVRYHC